MKFKIIRWIALIAGTVISVFIADAILFSFGYFYEGIRNGIQGPIIETVMGFLELLIPLLMIIGVIIAWNNTKKGGLMITVFAFLDLIVFFEPEICWMQFSMLFIGIVLLFYVYKNRKLSNY